MPGPWGTCFPAFTLQVGLRAPPSFLQLWPAPRNSLVLGHSSGLSLHRDHLMHRYRASSPTSKAEAVSRADTIISNSQTSLLCNNPISRMRTPRLERENTCPKSEDQEIIRFRSRSAQTRGPPAVPALHTLLTTGLASHQLWSRGAFPTC